MFVVCLGEDVLKRLEVGVFPENMHPPGRSVMNVVNKPAGRDSRCSWHSTTRYQNVA